MARSTGPRLRLARKVGVTLLGLTRKTIERRPYPPGQHSNRFRRRVSNYAIQLREKQKLRFYYGLTETQLRNSVRKASRMKGLPADNLAQILELRLDNVVFRLGFAPTIPSAKQLVRHGHILVNLHKVTVPSYSVHLGDQIEVKSSSKDHPLILEKPEISLPDYLERSPADLKGKCNSMPTIKDIPIEFEERLIAEYYAAR